MLAIVTTRLYVAVVTVLDVYIIVLIHVVSDQWVKVINSLCSI